ncbi:hypothetical protein EC968_004735 [Mortierella alpina]|nr:hypothetical protein EC968_004735 [Mortierella alpina]
MSPKHASATALGCLHCASPLSPSRNQPPPSFTQQRIPLASTPTPSDTISQPPSAPALEPGSAIQAITDAFHTLDSAAQLTLLTALINSCNTSQLTLLNNVIAPKLKRDFLHDLPLELAHHILSFVDDPQSLTRVSQVSRFWHQLVESEDWVWRAQCVKLFGPTSCSSLPSPKSHIAPPTSYLYTTSPTSLDAVSSTLKALSHSNNSNSNSNSSSSNQTSGCSGSNSPASLSHRLPLVSGSASLASTSSQSSSWANARDLSLTASHSNSGSSSSASTVSTTTATEDTEEVLSSMLLDSRNKRHSLPAFSSNSGLALSVLSSLESKATTTPVSAAAAAAALSTARKRKFKRSSLLDLKDVSVQSLNSTLVLTRQGRTLAQQAQDPDQLKPSCFSSSSSSSTSSRIRPCLQNQGRPQATLSYKAYFKRRFMIDRNWVSGRHTLISYTTPETGVVTSLQFDHHHIVVGCDNSRIQIFETTTGRLLRTLQGHHGGVWALEFLKGTTATGEKILVSGGCDREVRVWDMNTGKCRQVMCGHTGTIRCLKLHQLPQDTGDYSSSSSSSSSGGKRSPQQQHLAITGSRDATLRVWDLSTGKTRFLLQGHRDPVRCIEAHGNLLVSGSYDCTARVWSLLTGECLLVLQGHFQQIYSIAFNGEYIITGSLDSTCRLWSPVSGACLATLQGHTQLVGQLQLSGDNLMTGGGDGFMYLWNLRTFECQYRVQAHDQSVTSLCFDAKRIVTGGNDGAVKLWDRETGKFIRLLTKTDAAIWRVSICEERVVMCMQKNGRTAMEVMCFDSEAPVLPDPTASGYSAAEAAAAAVQQHEVLARGGAGLGAGAGGVHERLGQQRLWSAEGLGPYDDLRFSQLSLQ